MLVSAGALAVAVARALGRWIHFDIAGGGILLTAAAVAFTFMFWLAGYAFTGNT